MTTLFTMEIDRRDTGLSASGVWPRVGSGRGRITFIALCLASALLARLSFLSIPFEYDAAMFAYMGRLVSEGGRFGVDLVDNKFPTVGLLMSGMWRAFGAHWAAYVLIQTFIGIAAPLMLGRAVRRGVGEHGYWPTVAGGWVLLNLNFVVTGGFQLETLQAGFAVIAACAAISALAPEDEKRVAAIGAERARGGKPRYGLIGDAFLVGLATGCAAMVKPTGIAPLAAFAAAVVLFRWRRPGFVMAVGAAAAAGLGIPAAISYAYLSGSDTLEYLPKLASEIASYAANSSWDTLDWVKPITAVVFVGFPLLVRGWICRREGYRVETPTPREIALFAILWMAIEFAGVVAQRRMYSYHFLTLAPPAILLFGCLPRRDDWRVLAAALAPVMLLSCYSSSLTMPGLEADAAHRELVAYLERSTLPGDAIWEDGVMRTLLETELKSGSRYPMTFLFYNRDDAPTECAATILADFARNKPVAIVLPEDLERSVIYRADHIRELQAFPERRKNFLLAWEEIRGYVEANYVKGRRFGENVIWERR